MNLLQRITNFIKGLGNRTQNPSSSPNSIRYTFLSDERQNRNRQTQEYKTWYYGSSEDLVAFFTGSNVTASNDIVSMINKRQYFWALSVNEINLKRTHSGVPNAIITTLVNIIGDPKIKGANEVQTKLYNTLFEELELSELINQEQLPLTLVTGRGAFKIDYDLSLSSKPMWKFYDDLSYEPVRERGVLVGMVFKDFYKNNKSNYVLVDTRYKKKENGVWNSCIDYKLYILNQDDSLTDVPLETLEETKGLQNITFYGLDMILGVESKFFTDPINVNYGKSIFNGKCDLFDDLDQVLSQSGQTVRVSTPVEYYPTSLLERNANGGGAYMPSVYNRQFVKVNVVPNGDGEMGGQKIETTQPDLNFDKYNIEATNILNFILTGILSPASLGIDISRKDNADAQREKEKVSIFTAFNIKKQQKKIIKKVLILSLIMTEYLTSGQITNQDYDISIDFDDFSSPSFEMQLKSLSEAWSRDAISTKRYVELLWGDSLTDELKAEEVLFLEAQKQADNIDMSNLGGELINNELNDEE